MPAGRNKGGSPKEAVLGGGHGPRRTVAKVTPSGRARNAPRWSTAAALAMSEALQICVDREGGGRIAHVRALLCGREPAGFFASVRRRASRRDEQRVRDIVSSHCDRLPEQPSMAQLTREAKGLASTMASYYRGIERVEALGVQPAAAAGALERASLEQVCGRSDLQVGCHNERECSQQVARLREWGLMLGAKWCPPYTVASMTAMAVLRVMLSYVLRPLPSSSGGLPMPPHPPGRAPTPPPKPGLGRRGASPASPPRSRAPSRPAGQRPGARVRSRCAAGHARLPCDDPSAARYFERRCVFLILAVGVHLRYRTSQSTLQPGVFRRHAHSQN